MSEFFVRPLLLCGGLSSIWHHDLAGIRYRQKEGDDGFAHVAVITRLSNILVILLLKSTTSIGIVVCFGQPWVHRTIRWCWLVVWSFWLAGMVLIGVPSVKLLKKRTGVLLIWSRPPPPWSTQSLRHACSLPALIVGIGGEVMCLSLPPPPPPPFLPVFAKTQAFATCSSFNNRSPSEIHTSFVIGNSQVRQPLLLNFQP